MDEHMHALCRFEALQREIHEFDAARKMRRELRDPLCSQVGKKGVLFYSINFASSQSRQLGREDSQAAAALDTDGVPDLFCVGTKQEPIPARASGVVIDRNESDQVVDGSKAAGRELVENVHGKRESRNRTTSGF
ncbi:MAG TPA: hypothetical protein VMH23_11300 [Bacteroidota bacterium]|nr:hypothetical protein [Bacteroidota bacterium]